MANNEHVKILKNGRRNWNDWRLRNETVKIDLAGVDLTGTDLSDMIFNGALLSEAKLSGTNLSDSGLFEAYLYRADLSRAKLNAANLRGADLRRADLTDADLSSKYVGYLQKTYLTDANLTVTKLIRANLSEAALERANLVNANLTSANLRKADLTDADLSGANLSEADLTDALLRGVNLNDANLSRANLYQTDLTRASLVKTNLKEAKLSKCKVFGVSTWQVDLESTDQSDLIISDTYEPVITVDDLEVAQFIYLLLHNDKIRDVINTVANKAVLILGRFTPERKAVLDTVRQELRRRNYLPIIFDFDKPPERDFTETIITLAGLSKFVIADLSEPSSTPLEAHAIIPNVMIPFLPIIRDGERPFSMFGDLRRKYHEWVLDVVSYKDTEDLVKHFEEAIIKRAEKKFRELSHQKAKEFIEPIPVSKIE